MTDWISIDWRRYGDAYQDPFNGAAIAGFIALCFLGLWFTRYTNLSPTLWARRGGARHRAIASFFALCWAGQTIVQCVALEAILSPVDSPADRLSMAAQYSLSTVAAKGLLLCNMTQVIWMMWLIANNTLIRAAFRQMLDPSRVGDMVIMFPGPQLDSEKQTPARHKDCPGGRRASDRE